MNAKPGKQISVGVEVAVAEDLLQTGGSKLDEGAQQFVCGVVAISDDGQAQWLRNWQLLGDVLAVGQRGVIEEDEAGDVNCEDAAKNQQSVIGVSAARGGVHDHEQGNQRFRRADTYRRGDEHVGLACHSCVGLGSGVRNLTAS